MNRERLELLADILSRVARGDGGPAFNMRYWALKPRGFECATAACAMGHAALDPRMQRLGLGLEGVRSAVDGRVQADGEQSVTFGSHTGWLAVKEFFEIGLQTATRVFDWPWYGSRPDTMVGPQDVLARVRLLLELGEVDFLEVVKWPDGVSARMLMDEVRIDGELVS